MEGSRGFWTSEYQENIDHIIAHMLQMHIMQDTQVHKKCRKGMTCIYIYKPIGFVCTPLTHTDAFTLW